MDNNLIIIGFIFRPGLQQTIMSIAYGTKTLLAETGIIGFLLFLCFLGILFYHCMRLLKKSNVETKVLGLICTISLLGFSINWLQIDTFRLFGFALCAVIVHITISRIEIKE